MQTFKTTDNSAASACAVRTTMPFIFVLSDLIDCVGQSTPSAYNGVLSANLRDICVGRCVLCFHVVGQILKLIF